MIFNYQNPLGAKIFWEALHFFGMKIQLDLRDWAIAIKEFLEEHHFPDLLSWDRKHSRIFWNL
jgi:hypothetical protein